MLTYVTDVSLFESPAQTLVNTVNTVGIMGKGIAKIFKQQYPDMYRRYRSVCLSGQFDVGMLYVYRMPDRIIVNFPTKQHWRQRSRVAYIERGLAKFVDRYTDYGISSVAFPQLGCGHGELDWESQVQPVMERYLQDLPIPVYIHLYPVADDFIPERLDPEYAREAVQEQVSADRLWGDLQVVILGKTGHPFTMPMFGPKIKIDDDCIRFEPDDGSTPIEIYRDLLADVWNTLRTRGALKLDDVAYPEIDGAGGWLFDLLEQLDYVRPVTLRSPPDSADSRGLRYYPRSSTQAHFAEIAI